MAHIPVLLEETLALLDPKPGDFIVDGTLGGGGHAKAILEKLGPQGRLLATDWDARAVEHFKVPEGAGEVFVRNASYVDIPEILHNEKLGLADGMLLDLGFSSNQVDDAARGFSFQHDGPLDMRYAPAGPTAADIVNGCGEKELADIFYELGDERFSRQIAARIVESRRRKKITRTGELADIVRSALPARFRNGKINPATKVFQALRIYVNREFENVESILENADRCVRSGGRIVVITFHSTEDGIVKRKFRDLEKAGRVTVLTKKPVDPTLEEVRANPRSRSAKVRAAAVN